MRNLFSSLAVLIITVISCSKEFVDRHSDFNAPDLNGQEKVSTVIPNLDSIAKMESGYFLESNLTKRELDSIAKIESRESNRVLLTSYDSTAEYYDASNKIFLKIFYGNTTTEAQHPTLSIPVSSPYVLVGGGATTYDYDRGAYLTASYPDDDLTTWTGASKDHIVTDYHKLKVFAIGMRMANITPQYLRSKIRLDKRISEVANHPQMIATLINTNYLRLSGGAKVDWSGYGNLLYISQPYSEWQNSWFAASKDHRVASPCQITTYIIGIENIYYPNVGYIQVDTTFQRNYVYSPGEGALATPIRDGWALTGVGAHISYNFNGRLLATLWPYYYNQTPPYQEGYMESNWCYFYDFGWDRAYALMIRAVE